MSNPASRSILCLLLFFWLGSARPVSAQQIYENDFEDDPVGAYTTETLDADWNAPAFSNGVGEEESRVSVVAGEAAFDGQSLAVQYPKGKHRSRDTGAQWKLSFDGHADVTVEYRVKFAEGFDFVRGGKLPGLAGGMANSGGNAPNGSDGFSARIHWRTDGSGGSTLKSDQANIVQYMYHPDADRADDFKWDDGADGRWAKFESGRWYHIKQRIKLNTIAATGQLGRNDGIVQAWLDGQLVLDRDTVRYRDVDSLKIDVFYFSTFFGGSGQRWSTTAEGTALFDDVKIYVTPDED